MDDIQSWWEVPSIAHFCSLFRAAFNLLDFDIEELEEALLTDGAEDSGSSLLQELIVRLLCGCLGNNDISTFNYQMFLRRLFRQKCQEYGRDNPFNTDIDFQFLPLRTKVEILHALCDFRLDADDVQDLLKNLESDSLRVEPLGYDENHSAYWYFYGTRLYREDYPKVKKKAKEKRHRRKEEKRRKKRGKSPPPDSESDEKGSGIWQVVCFSEQDWDKITESFRDSTSKNERALFHTLAEDFLPEIPRLFAEKERLQRKRLLEYQPRRQSSRLEKLKQQKEEEEKMLQREEDERLRQESEKKQRLQQQEVLKKKENRALMVKDRATRALRRSLSRTNSECGSTGSIPDSLTDNRSNRSSTFVGRQTNNSLSSATGQIVIQGLRQKLRSSQVFKQTEEDLQTGMYKILEHIKNHDDAWPFADPVDEDYAPRYYSIIQQPMDLQRMEDKLDDGEYLTFADFKADFQLIVDNCRQYNGTGNEYTEMVGNLQEAFQMAVERYLESDPSSDEEVAVEFPTGASSESRTDTQGHRHKHHHRARRKKEKSRLTSHINRNAPSPESEHTVQSSTAEEREGTPAAVTREREQEDKMDHLGEGSMDTEGSSIKDDATELKRPHSHNGTKRRKKTGVIKNVAEIEALELATEQTLKDINKWLDDTPRFSEFSSASNSPSHLIGAEEYEVVGSRIESEYRRSLKLDRPPSRTSSRSNKDAKDLVNKRRSIKDSTKQHQQRRREIQRTIERLQPGKSKGNLISNIQSANKATDDVGGCSGLLGLGGKPKENRNSLLVKADEATPKLSLGTVLTSDVLGFGVTGCNSHNFNSLEETPVEDKKPTVLLAGSEETGASPRDIHNKLSPEKQKRSLPGGLQSPGIKKEDEKTAAEEGQSSSKSIKQEKVTPNLSAWFKAFGAPKTNAIQKQRKPEVSTQQDVDTYMEERRLETVRSPSPVPTDVPSCSGTQAVGDMGLRPPVQEDLERKMDDAPSPTQQSVAPAQRQRKVSTGSSMSERSSFSQDPMDPLDGYSAPYPSPLHRSPVAASPVMASPRSEDTPKPTASYPPLNGTIRVGFYQDISFSLQKSSPEKSNSSCSPQSPSPFQQPVYSPRYPPPNDTPGYLTYRNPAPGPPQTYDGLPVPPYSPVMQYYDTSKPLTDQYRAARTQPSEEYIPGSLSLSYTTGQHQGYPSPTPAPSSSLQYSSDRQSGFQLSVPRPSSANRSPSVPATNSGLLGSLPYTSSQQQGYDISVPRPSALHKSGPSVVTSSVPFSTSHQQGYDISIPRPSSTSKTSASAVTVPSTALPFISDRHQGYDTSVPRTSTTKVSSTAFPVKKRLYSDIESGSGLQHHHQTASRLHPSPPSPVTTASVTTPTPPPVGVSQPINLTPHTTDNRLTISTLGNAHTGGRLDRTSPVNAPQAQYSAVTEQVCTSPVSIPVSGPQTSVSQVSERLLPTSKQQTVPERITSNSVTEVDGAQHPESMLQASEKPHQSTGPHVTDRLYSEDIIQPSERRHLSVTSPVGNHQTSSVSALNIQQSIDTSHPSRQVSSKQPPADHLRQSPITVRVGNDITFHRGPFSPAAPSPISNFTNLSHIVDRFPSDGSPFYTTSGDKNRIFGQGSVQPPISSAAAAMAMFSQPAPTISYNRSVPELSSVLSSKVSDVQSVYSRTMPELSSVLPGKSAPPISVRPPSYDRAVSELSNYGRQTMEMSTSLPNKATPPMEGQTSYNHSVADLPSVLTNKVPPATAINVATPTYSRPVVVTDFSMVSTKVPPLVEASPLSVSAVATPTPKPSRKRKTKQAQQQQQQQQVTSSSDTSVSSSSTTAFQQYVSEPSAIALKTVQTSVVPGSAFNFGPATSGLGLYGDAAGFLDEYRSPPTGYYIPPGTEPGRDKQTPVPPAPSPFPFLGHPQPRPPPTYPQLAPAFINHQPALMDASGATTPLYQQYLQRHQEELLRHSAASAPMVLHQGLLAPPSGYPPGYHPALGIRQPYDALNRPSWL